jgi:pimeloyl-ACP methyl ester carboxylesterase
MPLTTINNARIEYERITAGPESPTIVMLHEGLGSVSMWTDFPEKLATATRSNILVYSRRGYGRSSPLQEPRSVHYMHDEALVVLPQLLDALGIANPILFGHSDGGSIALIHAGGSGRKVGGIVVLAPHVFLEEVSVNSIAAAKTAYQTTTLRDRLQRHHEDVDGAFWGWNDIWLHPHFRAWNIEKYLPDIRCKVLAIQGEADEYGTMEQIDRIGRSAPDVRLVKLGNCRHSPHKDRPDAVLQEVVDWLVSNGITGS